MVRGLPNDAAGNLFADAVLLPYVKSALPTAQRALGTARSGSSLSDDVLVVVTAIAREDYALALLASDKET